MRPDALRQQITGDRAAGFHAVCVVATAGDVNTGAIDPLDAIARLRRMQDRVRRLIIDSRAAGGGGLSGVTRTTEADTIYAIDAVVEPVVEEMAEEWSRQTPLVLISEGIEDVTGVEGKKVFPAGTREEDAVLRVIVDPIDGTRGLMYDKRPAWSLAGVAPNRGPQTRLGDIEVAVAGAKDKGAIPKRMRLP